MPKHGHTNTFPHLKEIERPYISQDLRRLVANRAEHLCKYCLIHEKDYNRNIEPELLSRWEPIIGKQASDGGIKKMKTKGGSCSISQSRIWLNLELAKKPIECLEYVLVHELVHLLEHHHDSQFKAYMDCFLPSGKQYQDILKREPLKNETWVN